MEKKLSLLFDFQHFQNNKRLAAMIQKAEQQNYCELSDDELQWVNAAGEVDEAKLKKNIGLELPDDD